MSRKASIMSKNTTASTELTSQYTTQVASDLEHNLKEQERVSSEVAVLQQHLADLQHDHTVLVNMQQALGIAPLSAESAVASEQATAPVARKQAAARTSTTAQAKKPGAAASTAVQPSLVNLIRQHLAEQSEPRSTVEITVALDQAHPDRSIKNTVVRTTLENLVAKGQAQRTKQGRSVYYTTPATLQPTPRNPTESEQQETQTGV